MRFSVNLRGDLAKLSDAELAARLEGAWRAYEAIEKSGWFWIGWPVGWRDPIRHLRVYRFFSALGLIIGGHWLFNILIAGLLSGKSTERFLRAEPEVDTHLTLCEIRDLTDEMERRVNSRKATKS
jgi:hypothetical protein